MKRLAAIALFLSLVVCAAWAQDIPTEEDYRNLGQTRDKLVRMKKEMDRFMKDIIGSYADIGGANTAVFGQDVRVDIAQDAGNVIVKADLPGMSKDKIDITLQNNRMLTIAGSRAVMMEQTGPGVIRQERSSGHFTRTLELPAECENSGIKATYAEGVLQIVLPKKKGAKEEAVKVSVQ